MNPKPFWPLNHFTVPVVIFFSKAHICAFRVTLTQNRFNSSMSLEKEPAGTFNKAQRLNEQLQATPHHRHLQGLARFNWSFEATRDGPAPTISRASCPTSSS